MGKRYYCDYCDKSIMNTLSIIKTHNNGMAHQRMMHEHYQQFKTPEEILEEESKKKPCIKFPKGICQFGLTCRYTHYSAEEINSLRNYVAYKKAQESQIIRPTFQDLYQQLQTQKSENEPSKDNVLIDDNGVTHVLPWKYNALLDTFVNLPPSIKRMKVEDFKGAQFSEWGSEES